ncbi:MAG: DUF5671 domain-containing protein, partial [Pseudomonadota bacterium]|nr:DUF5671 domain-containing protein [Pseudomonadota bacterium]
QDIHTALKQEGWLDDEINSALKQFGETSVAGVPVPRRKHYTSAKEGFLYLLTFVTLYICVFNFGSLIFNFIDMAFPDALNDYSNMSSIRFSISALIVAYPTFLWLTHSTGKSIAKDPTKADSKIRKWLIYFTLLVAATVIICDLIGLLVALLNGELTLHFVLKVSTILVIAAMIFGYYRWELSRYERSE